MLHSIAELLRRAPAVGWRRDYTARGQAHGHALLPDTRRRNGGHALLRVLREHRRNVQWGHHPGPRRQGGLVATIQVLDWKGERYE